MMLTMNEAKENQVCFQPTELEWAIYERDQARAERDALRALLDTPEVEDFDKGVPLEAAHQVKRWGSKHDSIKTPADWFWLIGYLAGKALAAHTKGDTEKARHHMISTAAGLRNWHRSIVIDIEAEDE